MSKIETRMSKIEARMREIANHDGIDFVFYDNKDAAAPLTTTSSTDVAANRRNLTLANLSQNLGEIVGGVGITDRIRVLVADDVLGVFRNEDHCVIIVFKKGHPIVKSVQRMGRRLLKQAVGPTRAPPAETPANTPAETPANTPAEAPANTPPSHDPRPDLL